MRGNPVLFNQGHPIGRVTQKTRADVSWPMTLGTSFSRGGRAALRKSATNIHWMIVIDKRLYFPATELVAHPVLEINNAVQIFHQRNASP